MILHDYVKIENFYDMFLMIKIHEIILGNVLMELRMYHVMHEICDVEMEKFKQVMKHVIQIIQIGKMENDYKDVIINVKYTMCKDQNVIVYTITKLNIQ
jgi:nucleoside-triphosphatase THEP1